MAQCLGFANFMPSFYKPFITKKNFNIPSRSAMDLKTGCRTVSNNGSGSGLAPAQNIFAVQVWFGFT